MSPWSGANVHIKSVHHHTCYCCERCPFQQGGTYLIYQGMTHLDFRPSHTSIISFFYAGADGTY
jgi:hypothetical protein